MFEYYIYSISPGQAAAHAGHAGLSGGHIVLLNIRFPVPITHILNTTSQGGRVLHGVLRNTESDEKKGQVLLGHRQLI